MAQWVKHLTSAQVMISRVHEFQLRVGLTAQSLEPALDSVSPSPCPSPALKLSLLKINIKKIKKKNPKVINT